MRSNPIAFLPPSGGDLPPGGGIGPRDGADEALLATRILIVDDEVMIAWMIESVLEEAGFTDLEIVSTSDLACASAARSLPGLLIADINLGGGPDGVDTAAEIMRLGTGAVLFVTAYADEDTLARVERAVPGASVLRKPVPAAALRQAVLRALRPRGTH